MIARHEGERDLLRICGYDHGGYIAWGWWKGWDGPGGLKDFIRRRLDRFPKLKWGFHIDGATWDWVMANDPPFIYEVVSDRVTGDIAIKELASGPPVVSNQLAYMRDGKRVPHRRPAPGRYVFNYSLLPHEKDWAEAKSYRAGWNLNYPLIPVTVDDAVTAKTLPANDRFMQLDNSTDSLILTVFKKAEDNDDLIVRFYETEGKKGSAILSLPGEKAEEIWLCDLRERPVQEIAPSGTIAYGPFEILTLRVKRVLHRS